MIFVDVPEAPEAPIVDEIFAENCQVAWQPPANDGGAPITGYHLERRMTSSPRWVKVNKDAIPELKLKAEELNEGEEYEFRVAAENKAGIGPFSPPSQPITAKNPWEKPGKPGRPEGSEITGDSMQLNWVAPESDGGAEITNYNIEYRVQGEMKWKKFETKDLVPDTTCPITGLKEDTYYELRVAAENKAGQGPWSDPSVPIKTIIGTTPASYYIYFGVVYTMCYYN